MNVPFVDLKCQYYAIKEEVDNAISSVIEKAAFIGGEFVRDFEEEFAKFCNARHCIGVGNGTDALFVSLLTLGIGRGDEVITAANSFIATSEAITLTGAKVIFCDIDPQTYLIDPGEIEKKITPATKAVIPVHLYGQPADMDPIIKIARRYDLKIIEDAAQAHGALYKGRRVGSLGDLACFSFFPGKNLGAFGDGGAIVCDDNALARRARMIANHGRIDKYDHEIEGINSRLDGLQAAILRVKLKYLPQWSRQRRQNAYNYNELLVDTQLTLPVEKEYNEAVYHLYVVRVVEDIREPLQAYLKDRGITTGIHYPTALPNLSAYKYLNHCESDFPNATMASRQILSLPMFPELSAEQMLYVSDSIKKFF